MVELNFLRLQRIVVDGLFDTYRHDIDLNLQDRVTLLHGPNGVGKTVVLGMINALLKERLDYFSEIPFARFLLQFHDGSALELSPTDAANGKSDRYVLTLTKNGNEHTAPIGLPTRIGAITAKYEYLRPHPDIAGTLIDIRDGEVLSAEDVLSRHSESHFEYRDDEDLSWLSGFLENAHVHLIEAQRLVRMEPDSWARREYLVRGRRPSMISTVVEYSRHFSKRLADTMAQYGRQSQTLDQSFPMRLMSAGDKLEPQELERRLSELDKKTAEYKKIGILDKTPTHPSPVSNFGNIDHTQARVMTLYVRDTEEKLQVLDDLATRTRLLLDNVNQKFRYKKIQLDREQGFVAASDSGQPLPLRSLSSGEQQELVLHYDLLFRVPSNTIVLIDEPELSLHVAWQKKFLPDLLEMVKLSNFDALVATHSPFVVGDRTDLMIGLGDAL